jgi:hypothetical protein
MAMPHDPSFSILYADLKAGKSSDALAAFPRGVYIAAPGALAPAEQVWGFDQPPRHDLETFKDISKFATSLNGSTLALICDDATLIADRTANYLRGKGLNGWDLWAAVLSQAIHMRDTLRRRGFHIVFTCHPRTAHTDNGVRVRGGPSFQGQCADKLPAAADFLLRAEARNDGLSGAPAVGWHMVYRTGYSPDWLQGSRYHTPDPAPMNLGEILRLAGYSIPRLPGLEWQEALADALARRLCDVGLGDAVLVQDALERVRDKALRSFTRSEAHAYWAVRDGYDRAVLWTAKAGQRKLMWGI